MESLESTVRLPVVRFTNSIMAVSHSGYESEQGIEAFGMKTKSTEVHDENSVMFDLELSDDSHSSVTMTGVLSHMGDETLRIINACPSPSWSPHKRTITDKVEEDILSITSEIEGNRAANIDSCTKVNISHGLESCEIDSGNSRFTFDKSIVVSPHGLKSTHQPFKLLNKPLICLYSDRSFSDRNCLETQSNIEKDTTLIFNNVPEKEVGPIEWNKSNRTNNDGQKMSVLNNSNASKDVLLPKLDNSRQNIATDSIPPTCEEILLNFSNPKNICIELLRDKDEKSWHTSDKTVVDEMYSFGSCDGCDKSLLNSGLNGSQLERSIKILVNSVKETKIDTLSPGRSDCSDFSSEENCLNSAFSNGEIFCNNAAVSINDVSEELVSINPEGCSFFTSQDCSISDRGLSLDASISEQLDKGVSNFSGECINISFEEDILDVSPDNPENRVSDFVEVGCADDTCSVEIDKMSLKIACKSAVHQSFDRSKLLNGNIEDKDAVSRTALVSNMCKLMPGRNCNNGLGHVGPVSDFSLYPSIEFPKSCLNTKEIEIKSDLCAQNSKKEVSLVSDTKSLQPSTNTICVNSQTSSIFNSYDETCICIDGAAEGTIEKNSITDSYQSSRSDGRNCSSIGEVLMADFLSDNSWNDSSITSQSENDSNASFLALNFDQISDSEKLRLAGILNHLKGQLRILSAQIIEEHREHEKTVAQLTEENKILKYNLFRPQSRRLTLLSDCLNGSLLNLQNYENYLHLYAVDEGKNYSGSTSVDNSSFPLNNSFYWDDYGGFNNNVEMVKEDSHLEKVFSNISNRCVTGNPEFNLQSGDQGVLFEQNDFSFSVCEKCQQSFQNAGRLDQSDLMKLKLGKLTAKIELLEIAKEDYIQRLAGLESDLESFKDEANHLRVSKEELKNEVALLHNHLDSVTKLHAQELKRNEHLKDQLDILNEKCQSLESSVQNSRANIQKFRDSLKAATSTIKKFSCIREYFANFLGVTSELKSNLKTIGEDYISLRRESTEKRLELESKLKSREEDIRKMEQKQLSLCQKFDALGKENTMLKDVVLKLKESYKFVLNDLFMSNLNELKGLGNLLKDKIENLKIDHNLNADALEQMLSELHSLRAHLEEHDFQFPIEKATRCPDCWELQTALKTFGERFSDLFPESPTLEEVLIVFEKVLNSQVSVRGWCFPKEEETKESQRSSKTITELRGHYETLGSESSCHSQNNSGSNVSGINLKSSFPIFQENSPKYSSEDRFIKRSTGQNEFHPLNQKQDCQCKELQEQVKELKLDLIDRNSKITRLQLQLEMEGNANSQKKQAIEEYKYEIKKAKEQLWEYQKKDHNNFFFSRLQRLDKAVQVGELESLQEERSEKRSEPSCLQLTGQPSGILLTHKVKEQEKTIMKLQKDKMILERLCSNRAIQIKGLKVQLESVQMIRQKSVAPRHPLEDLTSSDNRDRMKKT